MARPALATIDDLEALLGESVADSIQADARLAQASELVRAYAGVDWLNSDGDELEGVPGQIPGVVASIVERACLNPQGVTSDQETVGPFARTFSYGADAAARIYLTASDKLIIRRAAGVSALTVISTTRGAVETGNVLEAWDDEDGFSGSTAADDPYALWP